MTRDERIESLKSLADSWKPKLASRSDEIEKARQLPQDIADAFSQDGFYSLLVPEGYGGDELDPENYIEILQKLAQGDASAAWCVMICSTSAMTSAYIPEQTARELFPSGVNAIHSGVFAPMGKAVAEGDGYRVNGQWQWGSGSPNADYIWGGCLILENGAPKMRTAGLPVSRMMMFENKDVELLDTWHVSGLCGTGSTDYSVNNVFTPHVHSVDLGFDTPLDRPLYKFPVFGMLATGVSSVCLGIARAAIDELVSFADAKTPQGTRKTLANKIDTQMEVSRAEMELRSAQAWLLDAIGNAWEEANSGDPLSVECRRNLRLAAVNAAHSSASAVTRMYELGGGTSVYKRCSLQRHFRDIHVATRHMMVGNSVLEQTGRLLLGLDTDSTML
ncbi:MAG: acyl-CoA dehydrogenase family protein [Candidatus Hydrogenedentota bacterium]